MFDAQVSKHTDRANKLMDSAEHTVLDHAIESKYFPITSVHKFLSASQELILLLYNIFQARSSARTSTP
jgi:hypothetical protein